MMSHSPPDYHLRRIPSSRRDEPMEILDHSTESEPDRRKFLAVLMLMMEEFRTTVAAAAGQKDGEKSSKPDSDDDSSTDESEKPVVGWGNQWLIAAHRQAVTALAVSSDGKFLATASLDRTVKIWEMPGGLLRKWWPDGRIVKSLPARRGDIRAICFTGGQNTLAAMMDDSDIQLLNFPPRGRSPDLQNSRELSSVAAISGNGHRLGVATNTGQIQFWDLPERKPVAEIDCQASAMALSPDGRLAIRGGRNGQIQF